ncbi:hypothetical protein EON77_19835, partial [bacterium]
MLDRIRAPEPRARRVATVTISLLAAATFYGLAVAQGRPLVPLWHDSNMHMVQAQLIAHGKLWAAPHLLADHMETFHVFVKPVYAAIHFPGTSMLYAPFLMLGIGPAVFSAVMAGAVVGLCYRIVTEVVDGVAGAMAVPFLIAIAQFRIVSVMILSHHVALVPILLAVWAYLHWRRRAGGDPRWAVAMGLFLGFAAITRPLETLAYSVGIGVAIAVDLRGIGWRRWLATGLTIAVMTLPFVALQLVFNLNVTGNWRMPPYEQYNHVFHPGLAYGGSFAANAASIPTNLPQKVDYYYDFIVEETRMGTRHASNPLDLLVGQRIPIILHALSPNPYLLAFLPVALLGIT